MVLNALAFITLFLLSNSQYNDFQESKGLNYVISSFTQGLEGIEISSVQFQEKIKILKQNNNWIVEEPVQWNANSFSVNK